VENEDCSAGGVEGFEITSARVAYRRLRDGAVLPVLEMRRAFVTSGTGAALPPFRRQDHGEEAAPIAHGDPVLPAVEQRVERGGVTLRARG
jgi:hypothetical protein